MWPGSDTRPRDWSRVLVKKLAVEEASLHTLSSHSTMSVTNKSTNNRISTSGTCKFARDGPGPSYAIRITEMDMGLHFYQKWYMTASPFSVLTKPSTARLGHVHHITIIYHTMRDGMLTLGEYHGIG
ncbi:hypothetical protein BU17DRAFT_60090 [Hysterangium stoloniferum]|nr:hypothetical protein BU17DRAFT_60090 [Hysterangium stoloniferum]